MMIWGAFFVGYVNLEALFYITKTIYFCEEKWYNVTKVSLCADAMGTRHGLL